MRPKPHRIDRFSRRPGLHRAGAAALAALLLAGGLALAQSATPSEINYQGVLRDAAGVPLDGDYDMVFRFWSAETAGDEILADRHLAINAQAVTVSGGLFSVRIGSGEIVDGAGPGTYTSLVDVFADYPEVWLEVQIATETLSPRLAVSAAGYALNASRFAGRAPGEFLDTSSGGQTKHGRLVIDYRESTPSASSFRVYGGASAAVFTNSNGSRVNLAEEGKGISARGAEWAGYFSSPDTSSYAFIVDSNSGWAVDAWGERGSQFSNAGGLGGIAKLGLVDVGIEATGVTAAGLFDTRNDSGEAFLATGDVGIKAWGDNVGGAGGYFEHRSSGANAWIATNADGIAARGNEQGGYFADLTSGTNMRAAWGASTTAGNGAKNFVQNHPDDPSRIVVYAALEGDEVGTYTRGHARLEGGVARVSLGESFHLVTSPDVGLTAYLTPRSPGARLYVESVSTRELVVRAEPGTDPQAAFDFVVFGLRLGFEEVPVIRPATDGRMGYIPSMKEFEALRQTDTVAAASTPVARYGRMAGGPRLSAGSDPLARAREMIARVGAVDLGNVDRTLWAGQPPAAPALPDGTSAQEDREPRAARGPALDAGTTPSAPATARDAAADHLVVRVAGTVEPGTVLAIDPVAPDVMVTASRAGDPLVIGVADDPARLGLELAGDEALVAAPGSVVSVWADAAAGPIRPGTLLVAASLPGHVQAAPAAPVPGTILGKALDTLESGTGRIRVYVMPR
ncbi:MAG: hypothetical protein D6738_01855 [Acidobacteria bacterium]|nr:MAG: hypothetical protein D6738_01855 [Acidobacteriota bacterium]